MILTPDPNTGLDEIFPPPFYGFWEADLPESVLAAINRIRKTLTDEGPFHGAFAFSEGAAVLLSTLLHSALQSSALKFMVLVAPLPTFDITGRQRLDTNKTAGPIFQIPTILIEGSHDPLRPLVLLAKGLLSQDKTTVIEWTGDHTVPNSGEKWLWEKVVEAITSK